MKTRELIAAVNRNIASITARLSDDRKGILFYQRGEDEYFYYFPVDGYSRGNGNSSLEKIDTKCGRKIYMTQIFKLMDLIDEYIKTPYAERLDEERYFIILPMGNDKYRYLFKGDSGSLSPNSFNNLDELRRSRTNRFTMAEIMEIAPNYALFAIKEGTEDSLQIAAYR